MKGTATKTHFAHRFTKIAQILSQRSLIESKKNMKNNAQNFKKNVTRPPDKKK